MNKKLFNKELFKRSITLGTALCIASVTFGGTQPNNFNLQSSFTENYSGAGASADFDGDGDIDIVYSSEQGNIMLGLNNGTGDFTRSMLLESKDNYRSPIIVADINKDGKPDIIGVPGMNVLINQGNAVFQKLTQSFKNGTGGYGAVAVADINNDGHNDIVWVNSGQGATDMNEVWLNDGNTVFTYSTNFANTGVGPRNSVSVGDIDKDGDLDIVTGGGSWAGQVVLNNSGVFTASQQINGYLGGSRLVDWDKDGDLDIVNFDQYNNWGLKLCKNDGTGTFAAPVALAPSINNNEAHLVDLNGDTYLDVVMNTWGDSAIVYINDGCNLIASPKITLGESSHGVTIGDFNKDGKPDVVGFGRTSPNTLFVNNLDVVNGTTNVDCVLPTPVPNNFYYRSTIIERYAGAGASADFDGDGDIDIVFSSEAGNIMLGLNNGNGRFTHSMILESKDNYRSPIIVADINKDGKPDIIGVPGMNVLINQGNAVFQKLTQSFKNGTGGYGAVAVADINNDGHNDIVWVNSGQGATDMNEVWLNDGNTVFTYSTNFANTGVGPRNSVSVGDIDKDGDLDIVTGGGSWAGQVVLNNSGVFTASQQINGYLGGSRLVDWDKDGDLDIVNFDQYNNWGLKLCKNDGTGTFATPVVLAPSKSNNEAHLVDLNGDTYLDVVMNTWGDSAIVYINDGCDLIFSPGFLLGESSHGVTLGDYNKDGKVDAVCFGRDYPNTVHLNNLDKVTGTNSNACIVTALGMNENNLPSSIDFNYATKTISVSEGVEVVMMYDMTGKLIVEENNTSKIVLPNLKSGMYIIKSSLKDGKTETLKVLY